MYTNAKGEKVAHPYWVGPIINNGMIALVKQGKLGTSIVRINDYDRSTGYFDCTNLCKCRTENLHRNNIIETIFNDNHLKLKEWYLTYRGDIPWLYPEYWKICSTGKLPS